MAKPGETSRQMFYANGTTAAWHCDHCNGDQMCDACAEEVEYRTKAVRLLFHPGSPFYDPVLLIMSEKRRDWLVKQHKIAELAGKIRRKEVDVPDVLPMRVRHDDESQPKVAVAIYRASEGGSRRRMKEHSATSWS